MNNFDKGTKKNLRRCVSCFDMKNKNELFRVVRIDGSSIVYDAAGKMNGRGAYVCRTERCITKAFKEKKFERAFKMSLPQDTKDILEREFRQGGLLDGDHQ